MFTLHHLLFLRHYSFRIVGKESLSLNNGRNKRENPKLVNTYFDKLRADRIELLETNDDVILDIEPIGGGDKHCAPGEHVPAGTKTIIKQGGDLKFELIDYTVNGG